MSISLSLSLALSHLQRACKAGDDKEKERGCELEMEVAKGRKEGGTRRRLVLMLHDWHSFVYLRFSHSAGRQTGTRVA